MQVLGLYIDLILLTRLRQRVAAEVLLLMMLVSLVNGDQQQECRLVVTPTCLGLVVYRNTLPLVIFVQLFDHNSFT
jgi:hypothetical protein